MTEADKQKALELAKRQLAEHKSTIIEPTEDCGCDRCEVARALVECLEPVEMAYDEAIEPMHSLGRPHICRSCGSPDYAAIYKNHRYCPNCGKPLRWVK